MREQRYTYRKHNEYVACKLVSRRTQHLQMQKDSTLGFASLQA